MKSPLQNLEILLNKSLSLLPEEKTRLKLVFPRLPEKSQKEVLDILKEEVLAYEQSLYRVGKKLFRNLKDQNHKVSHQKFKKLIQEHAFEEEKERQNIQLDFS